MYFYKAIILGFLLVFSLEGKCSEKEKRVIFAKQKLEQFPELFYLLSPVQEFSPDKVHHATLKDYTWSSLIGREFSPEFEKTMASLYNLQLLYDGSVSAYKEFIEFQDAGTKLKFSQFQSLGSYISSARNKISIIEANVIIRDMGKSPRVRELARKECNLIEHDPHFFVNKVLEICPSIIKTYDDLADQDKGLIRRINIYHFGHFAYVEGGPEILSALKKSGNLLDNILTSIRNISDIVEVSACRAHIVPYGSLYLDERIFFILSSALKALEFLKDHTEEETFRFYLNLRKECVGLNPNEVDSDILARMVTLLKMVDSHDGKILRRAFYKLSGDEKRIIRAQLNPLQRLDGSTPTYMPALFNNIIYSLQENGISRAGAVDFVVKYGMVLVSEILESTSYIRKTKQDFVLSFNQAALQALQNPYLLNAKKYRVLEDGTVILLSK